MTSRAQVLALVDRGHSYEEIGARLGIAPGLAYLLATGMPADGSDAPSAGLQERRGLLASSQHLADPQPADNPTGRSTVHDWVRRRATTDAQMRSAYLARRQEQED